jgi:hypothetical protein
MKAPSNSHKEENANAQPSPDERPAENSDLLKSEVRSDASANSSSGGEEADYYVNEDGRVVFTASYLLKRGYCCGNGCRHCPYNYEAVPEPKRSLLLARRDTN